MDTLEKLWGAIPEEEEDSRMMDTEEETEPNSAKNAQQTTKTTKTTTTKNSDSKDKPMPLFTVAIRFNFHVPSKDIAANKHIIVLQSIHREMEHCEIVSTKGEKVNINETNTDDFEYHEQGRNQKTFIVIHKLILDKPYHQIKKNNVIFETVKQNNCYFQEHFWNINEWDIVNLGFLSGISPKHQSKKSVKHKLELIEKPHPRYQLHTTKLYKNHDIPKHGIPTYEIQCLRSDMEKVSTYIGHTGREYGQAFIKYKWKYTNPDVFNNALNKQNELVNEIRTIPIYGITADMMSTMQPELMKRKEILDVRATSKTTDLGRWNIYTKLPNFQSTTKWLQLNLSKLCNDVCKQAQEDCPPDFHPEVRFNRTIVFNNADDPLLQYATKCVNSFSDTSSTNTWNSEVSTKRTWASVASNSKGTSSITTTSELTKTIQKLSESISKICSRLNKIEDILTKHDEAIIQAQGFEKECNNNMQKLISFIERLEDKTERIKPRKLDDYYEASESNKRQNTNRSPQKSPPS